MEEDAMFTRKPFAGLACASCEKDVVNMYGRKTEYIPWGRLPFRDPSERIARVGKGFSKMLLMVNPEMLSKFEKSGSKYNSINISNAQTNIDNGNSQRTSAERYNPKTSTHRIFGASGFDDTDDG